MPTRAENEEKRQVLLNRLLGAEFIPVNHLSHLIEAFGGDSNVSGSANLKAALAETLKDDLSTLEEVVQYLELQYIMGRGRYSATWFQIQNKSPFYRNETERIAIIDGLRQLTGLASNEFERKLGRNETYVAQVLDWHGDGILVQFIVPKSVSFVLMSSNDRKHETGTSVRRVVVRQNGIEVRTNGTTAKKLADRVKSDLAQLGIAVGALASPMVGTRERRDALCQALNAALLFNRGKDASGAVGTIETGGKTSSTRREDRCLYRLAETNVATAEQLTWEFVDGKLEFDVAHEFGYNEERVGVELQEDGFLLPASASERALTKFWDAFDGISRRF